MQTAQNEEKNASSAEYPLEQAVEQGKQPL